MDDTIQLTPEIKRELSAIANDNISGASLLFHRVLNIFPNVVDELEKHDTKIFLLHLADLIFKLRPCMAPFAQLANYLKRMVDNEFDLPVIQSAFAALPHSFARKLKKEKEMIVQHALKAFESYRKILVHSRSSLVESFLDSWLKEDHNREIWITESRPMCEGTMLAKALSTLPNRKVLLVDDARGMAIHHVDAALIGVDRISETYIVNKIGSHSLAILAEDVKRPLFALAELIKFYPQELDLPDEPEHPGMEIDKKLKKVEYFNYYFEEIPLNYFDGIITSDGICGHAQISKIFEAGKWNAFAIEQVSSVLKHH